MNQQGQPQQQAAPGVSQIGNIQPAQIQQLAKYCNFEIQEAKRLGFDSAEGQEHLKKAQRYKNILIQYQKHQQGLAGNQTGQSNVAQSNQPTPQPQSQSPQLPQQSPQMNQVTQPSQTPQQQNQPMMQQPQPQQAQQGQHPVQLQNINTNLQGARLQTASPSPMNQGAATPTTSNSPNPQRNPFQQFQQLKTILAEFPKKLKAIEDAKNTQSLSPEALQKLVAQENLLKERYNTYKNAAVQLSQQVQRQQQQQQQQLQQQQQQNASGQIRPLSNAGTPQLPQNQGLMNIQNNNQQQQQPQIPQNQALGITNNSQTPQQNAQNMNLQNANNNFQFQQQTPQLQQNQIPLQQSQQQLNSIPKQQIPQAGVQSVSNLQQQQQLAQQKKNYQQPQPQQSRTGTPQPQNSSVNRSFSASGPTQGSPNTPVTNVNAAAKPTSSANGNMNLPGANVFKSSVPSLPINNQINVKGIQPVQTSAARPSLTGGQGLAAPALTTPAMLKLPPYEMQSDRVLSKRKLSELVKTVGADEGDGETTIDGDVEELLLDLADEFVTNVTNFACRLAKHRKSDNLDVKDVQLHLEKNWNIRIPGYSSDEIRNVRKWQPSGAHVQRVQGIGISKSVEQNK